LAHCGWPTGGPARRSVDLVSQYSTVDNRVDPPTPAAAPEEEPMKVLHVIATPRSDRSNTLQVTEQFLAGLGRHPGGLDVEVVDLFNEDLPALAGDNIETKYTLSHGQPIDRNHVDSWRQIEQLIARFLAADMYVISSPMWNLSIPYALKYYIDCIVQPGYLFRYNEQGYPEPLVLGKRMVCVTARGSDYSANSPIHALDFQEPYLRSIFGFVGITDIDFIRVQPTDIPGLREGAVAAALVEAQRVAATFADTIVPVP
jgi:FMN-dependent NADH-azoreductase